MSHVKGKLRTDELMNMQETIKRAPIYVYILTPLTNQRPRLGPDSEDLMGYASGMTIRVHFLLLGDQHKTVTTQARGVRY